MKTRKNIDRLFHDRLKNVETTPREDAWKNIASRLPQKEKKRRIIPLWFKLAGAAAVLALLFNVGNNLLNTSSESVNPKNSNSYSSSPKESKENFRSNNSESSDFEEKMNNNTNLLQSIIAETQIKINISSELNNTQQKEQNIFSSNTGYFKEIINLNSEQVTSGSKYTFEDYNIKAFNEEKLQNEKLEKAKNTQELLNDRIVSEENESEEETSELAVSTKRLSVSPTAAAVYFDNLGTENPIGNQFNDNKSSGEVSMSYGISIAYQISKRVKIRSGLNTMDFKYNTQDVEFTTAVRAITKNPEQPNSPTQINREITPFATSSISGELSQEIGFIEVPLEIEYAIINKQIELNIIGGASTLFLNRNLITLQTPDVPNSLGEAQNLNSVSFSTNIGMGVNYNISSNFQWKFEPIFKYQLHTFNNAPGVKPYNFGIYSGFSFKF